jgi:hypothetical protein
MHPTTGLSPLLKVSRPNGSNSFDITNFSSSPLKEPPA